MLQDTITAATRPVTDRPGDVVAVDIALTLQSANRTEFVSLPIGMGESLELAPEKPARVTIALELVAGQRVSISRD
jgi:hypothetical protein